MKSLIAISRRVLWSGFLFALGFLGVLAVTGNAQALTHIHTAGFNPLGWLGGLAASSLWPLIEGPVLGEAASVIHDLLVKFAVPVYNKLPDAVHRIIAAVLASVGTLSLGGHTISASGPFDTNWIAGALAAVVAWVGVWMTQHKAAQAKAAAPAPVK